MPRTKIVRLRQSPRDNSSIFDLNDDEDAMVTGPMGGCVSVILLWGAAGGRFAHVRGHHGSGGVDAIDWASLKAGVPAGANAADVLVVAAYSPDETPYSLQGIRDAIGNEMPGTRRVFAAHSDCYVGRTAPNPEVRQYASSEDGNFDIRGGGSAIL
jgi:hypothetical protein